MTARTVPWILLGAGLALPAASGCREDARLAGKKLRSATVRSVTYYGVTLDQEASPEEVAFVLLRAIRDDFLADSDAARESALDTQFDLCAANELQRKSRTARSRDEFIHNVVWRWTPTVSHYANDFETEWDKAKARFVRSRTDPQAEAAKEPQECEIRMKVADPSGNANAGVVMVIYMVRDSGYWRVMHLGFDPATRSIKEPKSAAAGGG